MPPLDTDFLLWAAIGAAIGAALSAGLAINKALGWLHFGSEPDPDPAIRIPDDRSPPAIAGVDVIWSALGGAMLGGGAALALLTLAMALG